MASTVNKLDHNMVRLEMEVGQAEFSEALKKSFAKNQRRFSVPGFRKGKAPMQIVVRHYGEGILYEDAIDYAADPVYEAALKEHDIKPFSRPRMDVQEVGGDKGMKFSVEFAVRPEVELGTYKGVEAYSPSTTVEESEIDKQIERDQIRASRLAPVEGRPIQEKDTVTMDFKGFVDDVAFQGGEGSNYDLLIGSGNFIPGFEDQMIGHSKGEQFDVNVSFPEDYHSADLAGKAARFEVTVHEIKARDLPALDDEFVRDISEDCETMAEYRAKIRKEQEDFKKKSADETLRRNAIEAAVKNAVIDIPHVVIHEEMEQMLNEQRQQMASQGFQLEDYLKYMGLDINTFAAQLHGPAENRVRTNLVLAAISKAEGFEAGSEDIDKHLAELAERYHSTVEELQVSFAEGAGRDYLIEDILQKKAADLILATAVATDKKPADAESEESSEEA